MKVVIIMGSASDESHAKKITDNLDNLNISWEQFVASQDKQPLEVLKILEDNANEESLVIRHNRRSINSGSPVSLEQTPNSPQLPVPHSQIRRI